MATETASDKEKRYPQNHTVLRAAAEIVRRKKAEAIEKEEYEDAARFHTKLQELETQLATQEAAGVIGTEPPASSSSSSSSVAAARAAKNRAPGVVAATGSSSSSSSVPSPAPPATSQSTSSKSKAVASTSSPVVEKSARGVNDEAYECICGTTLDAGTAFCLKCGTKVPEDKAKCTDEEADELDTKPARSLSRSLFSVPNPFHTVELLRSSGYSGSQAYALLGILYVAVVALEVGLLYAGWSMLSQTAGGGGDGFDDGDVGGFEAFEEVEF